MADGCQNQAAKILTVSPDGSFGVVAGVVAEILTFLKRNQQQYSIRILLQIVLI